MHPAIHNPHSTSTPSQRLAAAARDMRLAKINAQAIPDRPIACPSASVRSAMAAKPYPKVVAPRVAAGQPDYSAMWFYDLVFGTEHALPRILARSAVVAREYPRIDEIQIETARRYAVSRRDILSARRTANIVRPRQIAMYLAKVMTLKSLPEIGRRFGGRDHTTALHAIRKIGLLSAEDAMLAAELEDIKSAVMARLAG